MPAPTACAILHKPGLPRFLNTAMMAQNVFEIDVAPDVIAELAPIALETRKMEERSARFSLSNGVRLFNERPQNWRSDICWLSHADEASFTWFESLYRRLALGPLVAPYVPHDREVVLYAGSFVTRRRCEALDMHADWQTFDNLAFTLMLPLTSNGEALGMTYETIRGERREHVYRPGKGLVFGTKFMHSTSVGDAGERAVFLCMNFGTDRMDEWSSIGATTATQCDFLRQPDGTFTTQADWRARYGAAGVYSPTTSA